MGHLASLRVFIPGWWQVQGEFFPGECYLAFLKLRLLVPLLCMVLLALGLLGWMGWQLWSSDREAQSDRLQALLADRLQDFSRRLDEVITGREARLDSVLVQAADLDAEGRRLLTLGDRLVRQLFVLDATGDWAWPRPEDPGLSERERQFLRRAESLTGGGFAAAVGRRPGDDGALPDRGWREWYYGDGRHWALWRSLGEGDGIMGVELERMILLADLIEALPFEQGFIRSTSGLKSPGLASTREPDEGRRFLDRVAYRLLDERGQILHRWGGEPGSVEEGEILAWRELGRPLEGWRFEALGDIKALVGPGNRAFLILLVSALLAAGLVVVALAWFLYSQQEAELREARQRVNFVNQVSHELRTPLTNIGLYTELLQDRLPQQDSKARHYGEVIGAEVGRLGRLIHNVLTFSARERGRPVRVHRVPTVPDEVVGRVIECFEPMLRDQAIDCEWTRGASEPVMLDGDLLEQILSNLVSNVGKYATSGHWLGIETSVAGSRLRVRVSDRGPGVSARDRDRVFRPFVRLSDSLAEGASGAGLGLGIARDLARAHGGTLGCESGPGGIGAVFELDLEIGVQDNESENEEKP